MKQVRWAIKQCPRCGGDLYDEGDGWTCLQCCWEDPTPPVGYRDRIEEFRASNRRRRSDGTRRHGDGTDRDNGS